MVKLLAVNHKKLKDTIQLLEQRGIADKKNMVGLLP